MINKYNKAIKHNKILLLITVFLALRYVQFENKFMIFRFLQFYKVRTPNIEVGNINHHSVAYSLTNMYAKIIKMGQLLLKLSVVGWYTLLRPVYCLPSTRWWEKALSTLFI